MTGKSESVSAHERRVRHLPTELRDEAGKALFHVAMCPASLLRDAANEIERAWAARDSAVADLEAHAEAEVRRAVAAERERWLPLLRECEQSLSDMTGPCWPARAELLGRVQAILRA